MDAVNLPQSEPSFETHGRKTKPQINLAIVVMVLGFVAVIVIGWIVVQQFIGSGETAPSPTPQALGITEQQPTSQPTQTSVTDKKDLKVEVRNGTGIAKEASLLEEKLKKLGFETIETGNADNKTYDIAQVSFSDTLSQEIKDEVLKLLDETYSEIKEVSAKSTSTVDISIITGLRPGVERPTPKPSITASPTGSATPSATPQ